MNEFNTDSVLSVVCSQLAGGRVKQCDHMLQMLSPDQGSSLIVLFLSFPELHINEDSETTGITTMEEEQEL